MRRVLCTVLVAAVVLFAPTSARAGLLVPISGSDTVHAPPPATDDGTFGPLALGFSFSYYGTAQTSVFYNSNGNLTFGAGNITFSNVAFPTGGLPMIAPFWNDIVVPPGSLRTNALTPGMFVAIWNEVGFFGGGGPITAEAILLGAGNPFGLADGSIIFSYGTVTGANTFWNPDGATVGLNSGNGSTSHTLFPLGIGNSGGEVNPAAAMTLSDRSFLFTPDGRGGYTVSEFSVTAVPEPSTALLLGVGAAGLLGYARRRRTRA